MDLQQLYKGAGSHAPEKTPLAPQTPRTTQQKTKAAIKQALTGVPIAINQAYNTLTDDEISAINDGTLTAPQIRAFAAGLICSQVRTSGNKPSHYKKVCRCRHCGDVWLWETAPDSVKSCPWCFNRIHSLPIPRPATTAQTCSTCHHFTSDKINASCGMGKCAIEDPGLPWPWRKDCTYWIPNTGG